MGCFKKFLMILLSIFVGIPLLLWGYVEFRYVGTWTHRLDFVVETPEGSKTGSSTAIVRTHNQKWFPFAPYTTADVIAAEGAVIDLGKRGMLFTLLTADDSTLHCEYLVVKLFASLQKNPPYGSTNVPPEYIRYFRSLPPQTLPLPPKFWPTFVRFRDHNDPESVEKVDPHALNAVFGEGVRLVSASLTIAPSGYFPFRTFWQGAKPHWLFGTPVLRTMKAQLPWVGSYEMESKFDHALEKLEPRIAFTYQVGTRLFK